MAKALKDFSSRRSLLVFREDSRERWVWASSQRMEENLDRPRGRGRLFQIGSCVSKKARGKCVFTMTQTLVWKETLALLCSVSLGWLLRGP